MGCAQRCSSECNLILQVLSAKVVTNARSPGAKCYGIVTMSSSTEVSRCVAHLHRTELHGQLISVEKVSKTNFSKKGKLTRGLIQKSEVKLFESYQWSKFLILVHFRVLG